VRTAWLYGRDGNNFVAKILRAAGAAPLTGVTDEIATPTWTRDLAAAIAQLIEKQQYGVYHLTNAGQASRYEWVQEILRLAGETDVAVQPLTTAEFRASRAPGTVAPEKPPYSVLANTKAAALGIELRPWEEALSEYFASV
jgi:dTDP-4-dehydrorhamnose reductase